MSKVKAAKGDAKLSKKESKKATVKEGRVTKPAHTPKAKSKEIAKTAAASHAVREELKKKRAKKAPTPEPESDSESEPSDSSASRAVAGLGFGIRLGLRGGSLLGPLLLQLLSNSMTGSCSFGDLLAFRLWGMSRLSHTAFLDGSLL